MKFCCTNKTQPLACRCGSNNLSKHGLYKDGSQRYKCNAEHCHKTFNEHSIVHLQGRQEKRVVLQLLLLGLSTKEVAKELNLENNLISGWAKQFLPKLDILIQPEDRDDPIDHKKVDPIIDKLKKLFAYKVEKRKVVSKKSTPAPKKSTRKRS